MSCPRSVVTTTIRSQTLPIGSTLTIADPTGRPWVLYRANSSRAAVHLAPGQCFHRAELLEQGTVAGDRLRCRCTEAWEYEGLRLHIPGANHSAIDVPVGGRFAVREVGTDIYTCIDFEI